MSIRKSSLAFQVSMAAASGLLLFAVMLSPVCSTRAFADLGGASGGVLAAQQLSIAAIQPGLKNQTIETDEGTYTVTADDDCNLTITRFIAKDATQVIDCWTVPTSLENDGVAYTVTGCNMARLKTTPFLADTVVVPAGMNVTGLQVLANTGTKTLRISKGVSFNGGLTYNTGNFSGLSSLTDVEIGDDVMLNSNISLPNLTHLTIGENVSFTSGNTFKDCTSLTEVDLNGAAFTSGMFYGCTALQSVTGWKETSVIPDRLFTNCNSLSTIGLDFDTITKIGESAFANTTLGGEINLSQCIELGHGSFSQTGITLISVPSTVPNVPSNCFYGCKELSAAYFDCETVDARAFSTCPKLANISVGSHVLSIAKDAFQESGELATVTNYSSAMKYDAGALYNVSQDGEGNEVLEQVYPYIPEETQGADTVLHSHNVVINDGVVTIGSTITHVQEGAFAVNTQVRQFVIEDGCTACAVDDQGVLYNSDMTVLIKAPNTLINVDIPESVTRIARGAFYGCTGLTSITLPDNKIAIGDEAFKGCDKLETIALSSVTDLGVGVFEGVQMAVFKAGQYLWTEVAVKSGLADFVAEGGVPSINSLWFGWNYSASTLGASQTGDLNTSVTELDLSDYRSTFIPHYAFAGLAGVKEIALPAQVAEIGNGAFYFCTNLKDIYIYNPTAIQIATSSGGQGDSGSGIAGEEFAVSQPGSFAWWNPDLEGDSSTGAKYEDYSGLNFYGAAYAANPLVAFCTNMGHNFIPIVALDTLSAADNPFATDAQTEYALDYGTGSNDYGYVSIADIAVGGTPQVMAYFGDYATPRDLTGDAACAITYYGPDGKATTSFDVAGTYTAELVGDGKSVFGERTVSFEVKAVSIAGAVVTGVSGKTYTGQAQTQSPVVKVGGATLVAGTDYTVAYKNNVNAGTATMTITGKGKYEGSKSVDFAIAKASQAISAKKSVTKKFASKNGKLAKAKTIKLKSVAKVSAKTTVKYKKANKAGGKKIVVNKKTGKITVKKGLKAGTYKVKVKLTAAADGNYAAAKAKTITVKVVVKK